MMGIKARVFAPVGQLTLEELVPRDHFYRHVNRVLDLGFVRALVAPTYAAAVRPRIDPVVFFKLQLVMFFEGIRSERQLITVVADRLSLRWYVGYDLDERLPDHSSLTKIRERYGLSVFRRFFATITARCVAAGLVWGEELYVDATKVEANASRTSLVPRFAIEPHLRDLFTPDESAESEATPMHEEASDRRMTDAEALPSVLPTLLSEEQWTSLAAVNAQRHDWLAEAGKQRREVQNHHVRKRRAEQDTRRPSELDADLADTTRQPFARGHLGQSGQIRADRDHQAGRGQSQDVGGCFGVAVPPRPADEGFGIGAR